LIQQIPRADADPGKEMPWHPLAVEISTDRIQLFRDNRPIATVPMADLRRRFEESRQGAALAGFDPLVQPPFSPESALGLWVQNGRGNFRNVSLSPLD
jgi:hypothetical protein